MSPLCHDLQAPDQGETLHAQLNRLRRLEQEHVAAIYGEWRHPHNVHLNDEPYGYRRGPRSCPGVRVVSVFPAAAAPVTSAAGTSRAAYCGTCGAFAADPAHPEPDMKSMFPGRPPMAIEDRCFLRDPRNRDIVRRLWARIDAATLVVRGQPVPGFHDSLDEEVLLNEDDVPDCLVSHWRNIDYGDDGSRIAVIPAGFVARDLNQLGLSRQAVASDTVDFSPVCCESCRAARQRQQQQPRRPQPAQQPRSNPSKPAATGRKVASVFVREGSRDR